MSYFVTTSSLNLGNILSTESIAPRGMYPMRTMGFKYLDAISESEPTNLIRLYGNMPEFVKDSEGQPAMVLEFSNKILRDVKVDQLGNDWTEAPIYFAPDRDFTIWFESEPLLNAAFVQITKSIEPKFAELYKTRSKVIAKKPGGQKATTEPLFDDAMLAFSASEDINQVAKNFEMIDRIKGALFCCCAADELAVSKSLQADYVRYMQTVDVMVNTITEKNATKLNEAKNILESILFSFILTKVKKEKSKIKDDSFNLNEMLREFHKASIEIPQNASCDSVKLENLRIELERRIRDISGTLNRTAGRPSVCNIDGTPCVSLPDDNSMGDRLLNALIQKNLYIKAGKTLGYPFARECGGIIKDAMGEAWNDSPERQYINSLLLHLNDHQRFDAKATEGISKPNAQVLCALSMLCEREANKELEDFYRFLLVKGGVTDFRIPFALWGATFGFSSIPKTMLDGTEAKTQNAARKEFKKALEVLAKSKTET